MTVDGYDKKTKWSIGIKWKLIAILVTFVVCALVSIWFFQVQMLNIFYKNARFKELDEVSEAILPTLVDDKLTERTVNYYADNYNLDIWALELASETENELVITALSKSAEELEFKGSKMAALYDAALKNEGRYVAVVSLERFWYGPSVEVIEDNFGNGQQLPRLLSLYDEPAGTVFVKLVTLEGRTFMLVAHANLTPLQSTVSTLKYQFIYIGVAMVLMAIILGVIMSKMITKPFVKMNDAAKKLALGNYDADFSGEGYREINELAMTLNYASNELSKADALKKELIANISHDLRTPLTMIRGYSEVIRDIPDENTPENVQVIIDETNRLSELVNDMLDLSKIQSGTRRVCPEEFSITETVRDTLTRYEKLRMQEEYRIDFVCDGDVYVYADRGMLLQVIYNLINNAISYTGEDKYVLVRQKANEVCVRIEIVDTGDGIGEDDIAQIWDRYYRIDKIHRRAAIGTGLGLSIVKEILELHGASFGVNSEIGHGSTFWFELERSKLPEVFNVEYDNTEG